MQPGFLGGFTVSSGHAPARQVPLLPFYTSEEMEAQRKGMMWFTAVQDLPGNT